MSISQDRRQALHWEAAITQQVANVGMHEASAARERAALTTWVARGAAAGLDEHAIAELLAPLTPSRAEPVRLWLATRVGEVGCDELAQVAVRASSEGAAVRLAEDYAATRERGALVRFTVEPLPQEGEAGVVMEDMRSG